MYGCLTHCIGPGCPYWNECEQLCLTNKNLSPRSAIDIEDFNRADKAK